MKYFILFALFSSSLQASIVGVTTHPLNDLGRVFSAEMTGYMSQRNEMGAGIRYTQEIDEGKRFDISAAGGQQSRGTIITSGLDFEVLPEDVNQPRVSLKPNVQFQKFENTSSSLIGAAPTLRKGLSIKGYEFFPYLAVPSGLKLSEDSNFVYYSSLTLGASMPFPGADNDKILLSLEGNKNMGASSDYIGCLVSWVWK